VHQEATTTAVVVGATDGGASSGGKKRRKKKSSPQGAAVAGAETTKTTTTVVARGSSSDAGHVVHQEATTTAVVVGATDGGASSGGKRRRKKKSGQSDDAAVVALQETTKTTIEANCDETNSKGKRRRKKTNNTATGGATIEVVEKGAIVVAGSHSSSSDSSKRRNRSTPRPVDHGHEIEQVLHTTAVVHVEGSGSREGITVDVEVNKTIQVYHDSDGVEQRIENVETNVLATQEDSDGNVKIVERQEVEEVNVIARGGSGLSSCSLRRSSSSDHVLKQGISSHDGLRISAEDFDVSSSDERRTSIEADGAIIKVSTHHKSGPKGIFNGCQVNESDDSDYDSSTRIRNVQVQYPFATSHTVNYCVSGSRSSSSSCSSVRRNPNGSPRRNHAHYSKNGRYIGGKVGTDQAKF